MTVPRYTIPHHADCSIQPVTSERPFNLMVGTSPVVCKPKANFPETTIPVFNFRSNLHRHRCHADCSIQLVTSERPFNLMVGTSPVVCKPKANFPETTIPVFNFRSNLHCCHADCSIQLVTSERPFNLMVGTSPVVCKPKANFPETTIPVFNFRSNLHCCHADCSIQLVTSERPCPSVCPSVRPYLYTRKQ